jgi:hypothetical protein
VNKFPRITALDVPVFDLMSIPWVPLKQLELALKIAGIAARFERVFGKQKGQLDGPHAEDVENTLAAIGWPEPVWPV